jgi:hypothetical protein
MMSLRYAGRAKDIKNIPHRVVDHDPYGKGNDGPSLRGTVEEIERLKRLLEERAKVCSACLPSILFLYFFFIK